MMLLNQTEKLFEKLEKTANETPGTRAGHWMHNGKRYNFEFSYDDDSQGIRIELPPEDYSPAEFAKDFDKILDNPDPKHLSGNVGIAFFRGLAEGISKHGVMAGCKYKPSIFKPAKTLTFGIEDLEDPTEQLWLLSNSQATALFEKGMYAIEQMLDQKAAEK